MHPIESLPLRSTYVEVSLGRLRQNLAAIRQKVSPARLMPVVKANAYGHGLVQVAQHLQACGADALAVAILDEGVLLRQRGLHIPILVLGGWLETQIPYYLQHHLILTASSVANLEAIDRVAERLGVQAVVHLKVDTGMGRLGMPYYEAEKVLQASLIRRYIRVEAIFSHFANSDATDLTHAYLQLERFQEVLGFYERHSLERPWAHFANSGAILQMPESYFDWVRPGIMFYGVYPSKDVVRSVSVHPALTWKARPVFSKLLLPAHPVSYGSTWQSDHPVHLLTLSVGYADGYFRSLSNRAQVLIAGKRYDVVGRVTMDQTLVNLESDSVNSDAEVILLGESQGQKISAQDLADWAGTIPYEVLTSISARVPRVYLDETPKI